MIEMQELSMLRPQDTSTRERKCLNGLWQFRLDPDGEGRSAALRRRWRKDL
jgi:beta-glucuronidase